LKAQLGQDHSALALAGGRFTEVELTAGSLSQLVSELSLALEGAQAASSLSQAEQAAQQGTITLLKQYSQELQSAGADFEQR
jgi:hypothetical protein